VLTRSKRKLSSPPPTTASAPSGPVLTSGGGGGSTASGSLLSVPTGPPPTGPVPESVTQGGTVWGPASGGRSLLGLDTGVQPGMTHPFEPTTGPAGNFEQRRRFVVPGKRRGVILQHIRRDHTVEQHTGGTTRPMTDVEVDTMATGGGADAFATHHAYIEAFPVTPGKRTSADALEDTFGMTTIAPLAERGRYDGGDARALDTTTSGSFTMRGDARFYEHPDPYKFIKGLGFAKPKTPGFTPANGLYERRLGSLGTSSPFPALGGLDDVDALQPHSGRIEHSVTSSWDTRDPAKVESSLTLNGTPWVEPPPAKKRRKKTTP